MQGKLNQIQAKVDIVEQKAIRSKNEHIELRQKIAKGKKNYKSLLKRKKIAEKAISRLKNKIYQLEKNNKRLAKKNKNLKKKNLVAEKTAKNLQAQLDTS